MMLKNFRNFGGFIAGIAITLVLVLMVNVVFASTGERNISVFFDNIKILLNGSEINLKDVNGKAVEPFIYNGTTYIPVRAVSEAFGKNVIWDSTDKKVMISDKIDSPLSDLGFDTHYVPLKDINSNVIIEKTMNENQAEINGYIFDKSDIYEKLSAKPTLSKLLIDENGNFIAIEQITNNDGYEDICITKYDKNGKELLRNTYGGSDFDIAYAAKYNSKMGIVITGVSQSKDGDFANDNNSPFVACINAQNLELKWASPVQIADHVFFVTDNSVFVVRHEGEPYSGIGDYKLSVVKLDSTGQKLWSTEPLSQWIHSIIQLSDERIIVVQKFIDEQGNIEIGSIKCYNKNGELLSSFEADCYGEATPTDDGGFISVSIRNIKTVPQPIYISSIWYDTETVVTKYDKDLKLEWRKTFDSVKDAIGFDKIIPQPDGSIVVDLSN